ncbi:unnamed protein product, partial [Ectocarpus sp. 4 AP-2014]
MFGGYGGSGRLDDFWEFDFESRIWKEVHCQGPSPGVRENNGVVEYKGSLYLFGGYNGSQWLNDFHDFFFWFSPVCLMGGLSVDFFFWCTASTFLVCLDFQFTSGVLFLRLQGLVEPAGAPPVSRFGYVAVVHSHYFCLFGGYDGTTWLNDMHRFN